MNTTSFGVGLAVATLSEAGARTQAVEAHSRSAEPATSDRDRNIISKQG